MRKAKKLWGVGAVVLLVIAIGITTIKAGKTVYAASAAVVINEIMYNPAGEDQSKEFLELYNTTNADIDLEGWCFTDGITLCFSGVTIAAHDYLVISPNATSTQNTYGITPAAIYTGALSNGGEKLTLKDNTGTTVSSVTYSDGSPWPSSPDGTGPSLELKDPELDITQASSWAASLTGSTPGAQNSWTGIVAPELSNVTQPTGVQAGNAVVIQATATNADTVELVYKVMFDSDQTLQMYDDGAHNDGAAGDGVYAASIPQQSAGTLVRFRVEAANVSAAVSSPDISNTIDYYGYVVNSPTANGTITVLQWFMSDDDYDALINNPDQDDTYFPAVIAYGDQVFDNSQIRLKGNYSRTFEKKPFKVKLPNDHYLQMSGVLDYPLNEFHLNSDFPNGNHYLYSSLSWKIFQAAGFDIPTSEKIQINRNGNFEGVYLIADKYSDAYIEQNTRYANYERFDAWWEKDAPKNHDFSDLLDWEEQETTLTGQALHDYIRDHNDIPNLINYMAATAVARHHDWSKAQNLQVFHDKNGTGRFSLMPWDLDLTFSNLAWDGSTPAWAGGGYMIDPHDSPDYLPVEDRFMANVIFDDPELHDMYVRRVRTLVDQLWTSGAIKQWANDLAIKLKPGIELDYAKWHDLSDEQAQVDQIIAYIRDVLGYDPDDPQVVASYYQNVLQVDISELPDPITQIAPLSITNKLYIENNQMDVQANLYATLYVDEGLLPESEPEHPAVRINEIMYNPVGGSDYEYLEFYNPNNFAVDMSGWTVEGVGMTLPGGSVISAGGYAVITKDDVAWRQEYGGGVVTFGEYSGNLNNSGETIRLLRADASVADSVTYQASGGSWPEAANGQGYSLERLPDGNCWAASGQIGGSTGVANTADSSAVCIEDDYQAANQALLSSAENGQSILIDTPEDSTITCFSSMKESQLPQQDAEFSYPVGLVEFCFDTNQTDNLVSVTFVTDLKPEQVTARKYNSTQGTYATIENSSITSTVYAGQPALQVQYTLIDNGSLDLDPVIGKIKDPVGLAQVTGASTTTGAGVGAPNTGLAPRSPLSLLSLLAIGSLSYVVYRTLRRRVTF